MPSSSAPNSRDSLCASTTGAGSVGQMLSWGRKTGVCRWDVLSLYGSCGGYRSSICISCFCDRFVGIGKVLPWSLLAAHPYPSGGPWTEDLCERLWQRTCGVKEVAVSAWIWISLLCLASSYSKKNEFSVWSKLVEKREHLYRKRRSWHTCAGSFVLLTSVSVRHFCLLVFLMAQSPFHLPKPAMETVN